MRLLSLLRINSYSSHASIAFRWFVSARFNILNGAAEAGPAPEVKPAKADQKGPNNFNIISWGEKIGAQYTKPSPQ